jgi:hypothetical protein
MIPDQVQRQTQWVATAETFEHVTFRGIRKATKEEALKNLKVSMDVDTELASQFPPSKLLAARAAAAAARERETG